MNHLQHFSAIKLLIIFISFTLLQGCESQEALTEHEARQNIRISEKPLNDLLLEKTFRKQYQKVAEKKAALNARSALEDQYNFTIADKPVKIVEVDNRTYYNMLIERDSVNAVYFENLLMVTEVVESEEEVSAYIIKYIKGSEVIVEDIDPILSKYSMYCNYVCSLKCNDYNSSNTPLYNHQHFYDSGVCDTTDLVLECTEICFPSPFSGSDAGTGPPPGDPSGGGGSTTVILAPPSGQNGATQPQLVVLPVEDEVDPKDPCIIMNKLKNDTTFKSQLLALKTQTYSQHVEKAMVLNDGQSPTATDNYDYTQYIGTLGSPEARVLYSPSNIKGVIHCHYEGLLPIFSIGDLLLIYEILNQVTETDELVFGLVTQRGTVYAITITDRQKFIAFGNKFLNDEYKQSVLAIKLKEEYDIDEDNSVLDNEVGFLEMMRDYNLGISLSRGSIDTFNTWTKLEKPRNKPKIEINCN